MVLVGDVHVFLCVPCRDEFNHWWLHHPLCDDFWRTAGRFSAYAQGFPQTSGLSFDPAEFLDIARRVGDDVRAWIAGSYGEEREDA